MRAQKKTGILQRFQIEHLERPELGRQIVNSVSRESATVEAARRWGVRWATDVAYFQVTKLGVSPKPRCRRCGREFGGEGDVGVYCPECQRVADQYQRDMRQIRTADRRPGKR